MGRVTTSINPKTGLLFFSLISSALLSESLFAHGYLSQPESRGFACKLGQNADCGAIVWEPQSLEAPKGFPQNGPADGQIASAGQALFSPLDAQSATRWNKKTLQTGANNFTWRFTANHVAQGWRYFITRQGWSPNVALRRSAFDLTPFCSIDGQFKQPPMDVTHRCNIPADRSGYHVILAVWDVGDTANAFYNAVDVNIGNGGPTPPTWSDIGDINPVADLTAGDQVRARMFDANGENPSIETRIIIGSTVDGGKNVWPKLLAQAINQEHTDVKAGVMDAGGNIVPATGKNDVYALSGSGVQRIEISIEQVNIPVVKMEVTGVKSSYTIANSSASVTYTVAVQGTYVLDSEIYDSNNRLVGQNKTTLKNASKNISISLTSPQAGRYSLVVRGTPDKGAASQKTFSFTLQDQNSTPGKYDYLYPQSISLYKAGTKVLGSDGKIYQCKPFPYSGWCTINAHQYTPGTGSNWSDAWILLN